MSAPVPDDEVEPAVSVDVADGHAERLSSRGEGRALSRPEAAPSVREKYRHARPVEIRRHDVGEAVAVQVGGANPLVRVGPDFERRAGRREAPLAVAEEDRDLVLA